MDVFFSCIKISTEEHVILRYLFFVFLTIGKLLIIALEFGTYISLLIILSFSVEIYKIP